MAYCIDMGRVREMVSADGPLSATAQDYLERKKPRGSGTDGEVTEEEFLWAIDHSQYEEVNIADLPSRITLFYWRLGVANPVKLHEIHQKWKTGKGSSEDELDGIDPELVRESRGFKAVGESFIKAWRESRDD